MKSSENVTAPLPAAPKAVAPLTLAVLAAAIWTCLPELALINLELWATVTAGVWAFSNLFRLGEIGLWIFGVLFGLPALWVTGQTIRLALEEYRSERG